MNCGIRFGAIHQSLARPGAILRDSKTGEHIQVESVRQDKTSGPGQTTLSGLFFDKTHTHKQDTRSYPNEFYWSDAQSSLVKPEVVIPGLSLIAHPVNTKG